MRTRARHLFLIALSGLALGAPAAADAHARARVKVRSCDAGSAVFHARMRAVPGTRRMSIRFQLVARFAGHRPQRLDSDGLSDWHRSHRGVTRFGYSQTVKGLLQGGSYRVVVKFRWLGPHGRVLRRARRVSGPCVQDGGLPRLVIPWVKIGHGTASGTSLYTVAVRNRGTGAAENFTVSLYLDGALADEREVDRLEPGETQQITFNGPDCAHLRAVVDSGDTENDYERSC